MKLAALFLSLFVVACSSQNPHSSNSINTTNKGSSDNALLFVSLLNLDLSAYSYVDEQGKSHYDELAHFKALEKIYKKNAEPEKGRTTLNDQQLKTLLFMAFYAKHKNSGAFQGYLATDLMPIYKKQSEQLLSILASNGYLVEPTCERLNRYFGFEGMNAEKKAPFLKKNTIQIHEALGEEYGSLCLTQFSN